MSRVKGRTDDMLVIRGVNVFPSEIERVLLTHPELAPYYQIIVDRTSSMPRLEVDAEVGEAFFHTMGGSVMAEQLDSAIQDVQRLRRRLEENLQTALSLHAHVNLKPPGSVPRSEGKAVRVVERK
jgi:phenylacetate-CoA ligase